MTAEERKRKIEIYLSKVEFASLEELSRHVDASPSTVRRDLNLLEGAGNIRRTHGGACLVNQRADDYVFTQRETVQLAEKEAIARLCATLVQPGQSVIVDAGTTAFQAARELEGKGLHVITNSLPVANFFASSANTEVIVSGGIIYPRLGVLVGPLAVDLFSNTHADLAILSGAGITPDGISNSHALLIDIQRAMIQAASRVIFCFDHTKIGRRSVAHLCTLDRIDTVVTDSAAPPELLQALRERGVEVLVTGSAAPKATDAAEEESAPAAQTKSEHVDRDESADDGMSWD